MLKIGFQFFAHKKGGGSTKNGRDSESKRLGVKRADGQFVLAGNILASMSVSAATTPCLLWLTATSSSSARARIASSAPSTRNSKTQYGIPDIGALCSGFFYNGFHHLGYNLRREMWGMGCATEAAKAMLLWGTGRVWHLRFYRGARVRKHGLRQCHPQVRISACPPRNVC